MAQSISKRESELIDEIESRDMTFFRPRDVQRFLEISDRASYNMLSRMKHKDLIKRVQSGTYVLTETFNSVDVYELASNLVDGSYLGLFAALHFHGMTDQVPQTVQVVTTGRKRDLSIQGRKIEFVTVKENQFFGYRDYDGVVASTPEKTVVDSLRMPNKAGDISNILELDYSGLDLNLLMKYVEKTDNAAVAARTGYILDQKELDFPREKLKKFINGYTFLDPSRGRKNPVKEWKIYANREVS